MTTTEIGAAELAALREAVADVLTDVCTTDALGDPLATAGQVWQALHAIGVTRLGIPEEHGGDGGGLLAAFELVRVAGEHAAPGLLAETSMLAGWLLSAAGLPQPDGPVTTGAASLSVSEEGSGWRLRGAIARVPAAPGALVVAVAENAEKAEYLVEINGAAAQMDGHNLAGERRSTFSVDIAIASVFELPAGTAGELRLRGALSRSLLTAGALRRMQSMVVRYARERVQFGKPLAGFQAIQHQLARLAGEVAATNAAVDEAVRHVDSVGFTDPHAELLIAAAKVRSAQAASVAAGIAHQVHGAIGMTEEHALRFWTARLWSWRSEWGSEAAWSEHLADLCLPAGSAGLWTLLTGIA